ncbi:MAG: GDCCVxC domain-containing (seleno)protein [Methylocystis sp.]|uniref:GDCCVxC domain-containing (seleno)protein n=1 Tax=Methylocystis sp. TaxID=1911079 RepID=UPI003DA3FE03
MQFAATLTCPHCGHAEALAMPRDACVIAYDCPRCGARLAPKPGDCCVFCSYADVPCPPVQACCGRRA